MDKNSCVLSKTLSTVYVTGEITPAMAALFRQHIQTLEAREKTKEIVVEINSEGGQCYAGMAMAATVEACKKPVVTRVTGYAMSMGAILLASGHRREALEHSVIMVHQTNGRLGGGFSDLVNNMAEYKRVDSQVSDWLDARTGKRRGYWRQRYGTTDLYLTPTQALSSNLIDTIIKKVDLV